MEGAPEKKGPLAALLAGLEPKQVTVLLLGLSGALGSIGNCHRAEEAKDQGDQQYAAVVTMAGSAYLKADTLSRKLKVAEARIWRLEHRAGYRQLGALPPGAEQLAGPPEPPKKGTLMAALARLWPF